MLHAGMCVVAVHAVHMAVVGYFRCATSIYHFLRGNIPNDVSRFHEGGGSGRNGVRIRRVVQEGVGGDESGVGSGIRRRGDDEVAVIRVRVISKRKGNRLLRVVGCNLAIAIAVASDVAKSEG